MPGPRGGDVDIGPMRLVSIRRFGRYRRGKYLPAEEGYHFAGKVPLLLESGTHLRWAVARRSRRHAALSYGRRRSGAPKVRKGDSVLDFEACDSATSFWPGAILVDGPQCVTLHFYVNDSEQPEERRIAFGRGTCRSRRAPR